MTWLGLDIGGANLKAADGRGWASCVPFALWKDPSGLSAAISRLIESAPVAERIAITMTGELCDCFATKADGVQTIVSAVQLAAQDRAVAVYLIDGRLVPTAIAQRVPHLAAASNWHALARYSCRFIGSSIGLLIDIGSTTTDIIPLVESEPRPRGWNDTDRLLAGELVYTGVGRTPVCAITNWLPWRGVRCPVAAELFATAADAYVILGSVAEQSGGWSVATADGRPMSKDFARARLARMICADVTSFDQHDARSAAERVRDAQLEVISAALAQVLKYLPTQPNYWILSGSGEFLARAVVDRRLSSGAGVISLSERLGPGVAAAAPAHALAALAADVAMPDES